METNEEVQRLKDAIRLALESLEGDGGIAPAVVALRWALKRGGPPPMTDELRELEPCPREAARVVRRLEAALPLVLANQEALLSLAAASSDTDEGLFRVWI